MLQEFCRRVGIRATDEGIADLISALSVLPPGHPLETLLREAPDFKQEAAWPMRCCTRRTGLILCRNYSILLSAQA